MKKKFCFSLLVIIIIFGLFSTNIASSDTINDYINNSNNIKWTKIFGKDTRSVNAVAYGMKIYVAAGDGGLIKRSNDGINWTLEDSGVNCNVYDIVWTGNRFVALANEYSKDIKSYKVLISQDGVKWEQHAIKNDMYLQGLIKVGDYIYSSGNGIYRSKDGINWSRALVCKGNDQYIRELSWDGKKFVAIKKDNTIIISSDGTNWRSFCKITMSEVYSLASDGKGFVILASQNYPDSENPNATVIQTGVFYSIDGVKWTSALSLNDDINAVHWNGKQFLLISSCGYVAVSPDGIKWDVKKIGFENSETDRIIWSEDRYIAACTNGEIIESSDGTAWKIIMPEVEPVINYSRVIWDGTKYIMFDNTEQATIKTSLNGIEWDSRFENTSISIQDIAWSGEHFVAATSDKCVVVSNDGIHWSLIRTDLYFQGITWNGKCFMAVGLDGLVAVSEDGSKWTKKITTFNKGIRSLASNQYGFVANTDSENKNFYFSKDGYNWNLIKEYSGWEIYSTSSNNKCFTAFAYDKNNSPYILYSADGTNWTNIPINMESSGIVWNGQMFVAGGNGEALFSKNGKDWLPFKCSQEEFFSNMFIDKNGIMLVTDEGELLTGTLQD